MRGQLVSLEMQEVHEHSVFSRNYSHTWCICYNPIFFVSFNVFSDVSEPLTLTMSMVKTTQWEPQTEGKKMTLLSTTWFPYIWNRIQGCHLCWQNSTSLGGEWWQLFQLIFSSHCRLQLFPHAVLEGLLMPPPEAEFQEVWWTAVWLRCIYVILHPFHSTPYVKGTWIIKLNYTVSTNMLFYMHYIALI